MTDASPRPPRLSAPFLFLAAATFAVSLLKGLRMPNLWSATHMTFNYSHGFIRRGLVGTVLRALGGGWIFHYQALALLSVIIFAATALAMSRLIVRLLRAAPDDRALQAAILVFAASPGVVFLAHEIGYLDFIGLGSVIVFVLGARRARHRYRVFYAAAALGIVFALIHESMVIMFVPTLLFACACHIVVQSRQNAVAPRTQAFMAAHAVTAAILAFVASSVVGIVGTKPLPEIRALQASIAAVANFPLRPDAFDALARPVRENLHQLMPWYWRNPANRAYLGNGLWAAAPGLLFLFGYGSWMIARLRQATATRVVLEVIFFGAAFGPLTLNFVGWDAARWNAICLTAAFMGVATLRLFFSAPVGDGPALEIRSPWLLALAATAVVLGAATNYDRFLFDGYVVRWFPFVDQVQAAIDLARGHFNFIPRF